MSMIHLNEESRKYDEREDEKVAKKHTIFYIEYRSNEQAQSLCNETHQKINEKKSCKAKHLIRLTGHKVRDENENRCAEHLNGYIGDDETDKIRSHRVPSIEMFTFDNRKLQWNCSSKRKAELFDEKLYA